MCGGVSSCFVVASVVSGFASILLFLSLVVEVEVVLLLMVEFSGAGSLVVFN